MNILEKLKSLFKREPVYMADEEVNNFTEFNESVQNIADQYKLPAMTHELDGLYVSKETGRIFEAEIVIGRAFIKYADETLPTKRVIPYWLFEMQFLHYDCYESLINYKEALQ